MSQLTAADATVTFKGDPLVTKRPHVEEGVSNGDPAEVAQLTSGSDVEPAPVASEVLDNVTKQRPERQLQPSRQEMEALDSIRRSMMSGAVDRAARGLRGLAASKSAPVRTAVVGAAGLLVNAGHYDQALSVVAKLDKDGLFPEFQAWSKMVAAEAYRGKRDFDAALGAAQEAVALSPEEPGVRLQYAVLQKHAGKLGDAIDTVEKMVQGGQADELTKLVLAGYVAKSGQTAVADAMFDAVDPKGMPAQEYAKNVAWYAAIRGHKGTMLTYLEAGLQTDNEATMAYAKMETEFDPYRKDADFQRLMAKY